MVTTPSSLAWTGGSLVAFGFSVTSTVSFARKPGKMIFCVPPCTTDAELASAVTSLGWLMDENVTDDAADDEAAPE